MRKRPKYLFHPQARQSMERPKMDIANAHPGVAGTGKLAAGKLAAIFAERIIYAIPFPMRDKKGSSMPKNIAINEQIARGITQNPIKGTAIKFAKTNQG
ncbi:5 -3 exonuclease [Lasius niger]|uniref:5-3 exonuclease n=1 Tax=Lasius niger TaxID=67767 RepID=A0A0J7KJ33_LASNI|nr:5 -3 exonuclease [Lasius niger]